MAPKQKKKKKQGGDEGSKTEEVDEEKRLAEEARVRESNTNMKIRKLLNYSIVFKHFILLGSDSGGEVEDCYQRGPDLFPHARPAGNVGRLHKMGHVC